MFTVYKIHVITMANKIWKPDSGFNESWEHYTNIFLSVSKIILWHFNEKKKKKVKQFIFQLHKPSQRSTLKLLNIAATPYLPVSVSASYALMPHWKVIEK